MKTIAKIKMTGVFMILAILFSGCNKNNDNKIITLPMKEKQISFSQKNHALDNNDNFSPDNRFLCYDTRGTVFNDNIGNCKTIEKIEIVTGKETVLYEPQSITGEHAAPGVGAVSYHPKEDKVIFIHGPMVNEVAERGYYGIPNRTGVEVSADGNAIVTKVDQRDVAIDRPTIPGAHRGGTHRHEYTRKGNRIGCTYNDFLCMDYDRTIGYLEPGDAAPQGYSHYFAVLLKPAKIGTAKPGEIEKAYGDSWVDDEGKIRAFIGKVRSENGIDYQEDLFSVEIPDNVDITTACSGDKNNFPTPPEGVILRRLTNCGGITGIARGSNDGKQIAYLAKDKNGVSQINIISPFGSDLANDVESMPTKLTSFNADAGYIRWHPNGAWIFSIVEGNIMATGTNKGKYPVKSIMLTNDENQRSQLVVSRNGDMIAYNIAVTVQNDTGDKATFMQIFVMELENNKLQKAIHN